MQPSPQQLKLLALDEQDLAIVSAHVQDAVMKVSDIVWLPAEKRLILTMNRFAWEKKRRLFSRQHERRRAALHFEAVGRLRSSGIDRDRPDDVLDLLAVRFRQTEAPAGEIELDFAGGVTMLLAVDYIEARLTDLGAAWATGARPRHGM
jgi:hypothetical protein